MPGFTLGELERFAGGDKDRADLLAVESDFSDASVGAAGSVVDPQLDKIKSFVLKLS